VGPDRRDEQLAAELREAYRILRRANGHLRWWPGRSRLEIIVGAILTQNTSWMNVTRAIRGLRSARLLSVEALRAARLPVIEKAIRPSGYYRQKARKLKAFVSWVDDAYGGYLRNLGRVPTERLRTELLSVWGIGPETADSILLYAYARAVFVIDAYTTRIARRHRWTAATCRYADLQALFTASLPREVDLYNDYHAQLVWVGKHHCRSQPDCRGCPLASLLRR
jgi:endonuclease-3 related protein